MSGDRSAPEAADGAEGATDHAPPEVRAGLHSWRHPAIVTAALLSLASGFAQFAVTAALADVAAFFGEPIDAPVDEALGIADQIGLSGTTLGIGLAVIRFASLGSMPLAALADRLGRRVVILGCISGGLLLTATGALSPTFWWFVALFALARPMLSATNAVAGVIAAEETTSRHRASAMALVAAGYGIGAGLAAVARGVGGDLIGFRALFASALVPLVLVWIFSRRLEEPSRYAQLDVDIPDLAARPRFGGVGRELRGRLALVSLLAFAIAFATGPVNTYLFVFGEGVLGVSAGLMATLVAAAGPVGLLGLLLGRWGADRLGRRVTAAVAQLVICGAAVVTYNVGVPGLAGGYLLAMLAGAAFAPAMSALASEVFPTHVRSTAAGWLAAAGVVGAVGGLLAFGALADVFDSFGPAAVVLAVPVTLVAVGYAFLPETKGLELEESAPIHLREDGGDVR